MIFLLKYWKVALALSLIIGSFYSGVRWESMKNDSELLAQRDSLLARLEIEQNRSFEFSRELEKERAKLKARESAHRRELAKIVDSSDVYDRVCVTDDGLRFLNGIIADGVTSRKHIGGVP